MEEKFGGRTYQSQKAKDDKKKLEKNKAAIGFVYEDSTDANVDKDARPVPDKLKSNKSMVFADPRTKGNDGEDGEDDSDSDIDLDMTVDIMALNTDSQRDINRVGKGYNLGRDDFIKFLARDIEEQQELKAAKQQEEEKAMYSVSCTKNYYSIWTEYLTMANFMKYFILKANKLIFYIYFLRGTSVI